MDPDGSIRFGHVLPVLQRVPGPAKPRAHLGRRFHHEHLGMAVLRALTLGHRRHAIHRDGGRHRLPRALTGLPGHLLGPDLTTKSYKGFLPFRRPFL